MVACGAVRCGGLQNVRFLASHDPANSEPGTNSQPRQSTIRASVRARAKNSPNNKHKHAGTRILRNPDGRGSRHMRARFLEIAREFCWLSYVRGFSLRAYRVDQGIFVGNDKYADV